MDFPASMTIPTIAKIDFIHYDNATDKDFEAIFTNFNIAENLEDVNTHVDKFYEIKIFCFYYSDNSSETLEHCFQSLERNTNHSIEKRSFSVNRVISLAEDVLVNWNRSATIKTLCAETTVYKPFMQNVSDFGTLIVYIRMACVLGFIAASIAAIAGIMTLMEQFELSKQKRKDENSDLDPVGKQ